MAQRLVQLFNLLVIISFVIHFQFCCRIGESFISRWEQRTYTSEEFEEMQRSLFDRLCPLLIIKVLPLKTFNDLNSSIMYGHLSKNIIQGIYFCLVSACLIILMAILILPLPNYCSHVKDL